MYISHPGCIFQAEGHNFRFQFLNWKMTNLWNGISYHLLKSRNIATLNSFKSYGELQKSYGSWKSYDSYNRVKGVTKNYQKYYFYIFWYFKPWWLLIMGFCPYLSRFDQQTCEIVRNNKIKFFSNFAYWKSLVSTAPMKNMVFRDFWIKIDKKVTFSIFFLLILPWFVARC